MALKLDIGLCEHRRCGRTVGVGEQGIWSNEEEQVGTMDYLGRDIVGWRRRFMWRGLGI